MYQKHPARGYHACEHAQVLPGSPFWLQKRIERQFISLCPRRFALISGGRRVSSETTRAARHWCPSQTLASDDPNTRCRIGANGGFCGRTVFGASAPVPLAFFPCCRAGVDTMNRAVRTRRLASPVRVVLARDLAGPLDGAWWPHTASIADELPELIGAISPRLGEIRAISINWSSLEGSPDLDALNTVTRMAATRTVGHQRLMTISGAKASAGLLVVPCRTSTALAVAVMRQASGLPVLPADADRREFRTADEIVCAARAECALWFQQLGVPIRTPAGESHPAVTV